MKNDKLNAMQKKYCRERVKGKTQRQAYRAAGYSKNNSDVTCDVAACQMEKLPKIQAELKRLTALAENGAILDRQQRQSMLSEMAMDQDMKAENRQRAIDMLNRMNGDYTDKQVIESHSMVELSYDEKRQAVLNALMSDNE